MQAFAEQLVRLGHVWVDGRSQSPSLLQVPAGCRVVPVHDAPHDVDWNSHLPSLRFAHVPVQSRLEPTHAERVPCGDPEATGVQVPSWPDTSQARHDSVQLVLQQ